MKKHAYTLHTCGVVHYKLDYRGYRFITYIKLYYKVVFDLCFNNREEKREHSWALAVASCTVGVKYVHRGVWRIGVHA